MRSLPFSRSQAGNRRATKCASRPRNAEASLQKQYSWLLLSRLIAAALQAVLLATFARQIDVGEFGLVLGVVGAVTAFGGLADLGVGPLMLRERSRDRDSALVSSALKFNDISSSFIAIIVCVAIGISAGVSGNPLLLQLLPIAVWVAAEKNSTFWLHLAVADGKTYVNVLTLTVRRALGLTAFLFLLVWTPPVLSYAVGLALGSLMGNVVTRRLLGNSVEHQGADPLSPRILKASFPFFLNTASTQLRNLDVSLVSMVAGTAVAGVYAVPSRLTSPLQLVPTSLGSLILKASVREERALTRRAAQLAVAVIALMGALLSLFAIYAEEVVTVLVGPQYAAAADPLRVVCVSLVFATAASFAASHLQGAGLERYVGHVAVAITFVTLGFVSAGAAAFGAYGAAWGLGVSHVLNLFLLLIKVDRLRRARQACEAPA